MRILVINPRQESLDAMCASLRRAGFDCEGHASPITATFAFAFGARPFDAVVAEEGMGGMSGGDMLRVLDAFTPDIPIILTNAEGGLDSSRSAEARGQGHALLERRRFFEVFNDTANPELVTQAVHRLSARLPRTAMAMLA